MNRALGALFDRLLGSGPPSQPPDPWSLEHPLLDLGDGDTWTTADACCGLQIFGDPGSGKTSGSGRAVARAMLKAGFGGLVLTVKSSEAERWTRLVKDCGREKDLVLFSAEGSHRFNFLEYERTRPGRGGGRTANLAELFVAAASSGGGAAAARSRDPFWDNALRQLLRNILDALRLADEPVTLDRMHRVVTSAPLSAGDIDDDDWKRSSYLFDLLARASERELTDSDRADLRVTANFWLEEFAGVMDAKTRGNIISTFTTLADGFLRGDLRELFCTTLTLSPEATFDGKIIVLDLPSKQFHELGKAAQCLWKSCWQRAVEQASRGPDARPLFLWADEAQHFLTPREPEFAQTAREQKACCVYLTQSRSNYLHALGPGQQAAVESFLGVLKTKIFHCNGDPETNEWAERTIARDYRTRFSSSTTESPIRNGQGWTTRQPQRGTQSSVELAARLNAVEFTKLACGGPPHWQTEAILFQSGRRFYPGGANWTRVRFNQHAAPIAAKE